MLKIPMVFLRFQQERPDRNSARFLIKNNLFLVFLLKCLQTRCVWYDFDMGARVMTLWYFLQGIIEICCLEIKKCARMVLFDRDEGGGRYRDLLAWYEFI